MLTVQIWKAIEAYEKEKAFLIKVLAIPDGQFSLVDEEIQKLKNLANETNKNNHQ